MKELDESRVVETVLKSRSTKELDELAEGDDIKQSRARKGSKLADKKPDNIRVEEHDRAAKTKDREQLEGPHMFHTTKYGPEDLLVMKTKVSTVKGTKEGKVQTVEALADSGASIISWYLAKKVNMMIFEKGDATLKDASQ